jgi:hypothetical protein
VYGQDHTYASCYCCYRCLNAYLLGLAAFAGHLWRLLRIIACHISLTMRLSGITLEAT